MRAPVSCAKCAASQARDTAARAQAQCGRTAVLEKKLGAKGAMHCIENRRYKSACQHEPRKGSPLPPPKEQKGFLKTPKTAKGMGRIGQKSCCVGSSSSGFAGPSSPPPGICISCTLMVASSALLHDVSSSNLTLNTTYPLPLHRAQDGTKWVP